MKNDGTASELMRRHFAALLFFCLLVPLLLIRVNSHKYSLDTSHTVDILQNFLNGGGLYSHIAGMHRFNLHFSPIYYLIAPAVRLDISAFIFLWKLVCFGAFILCVNFILRDAKNISCDSRNIILVMVMLNPTIFLGILDVNIWDTDLTLPFIGLSLLALTRNHYPMSVCCFAATFLVKEDMPLVAVLFGVLVALMAGNKRYVLFSAISLVVFLVITKFIMPSYSSAGDGLELLFQNFGYLGTSFTDILRNIAKDPLIILDSGYWLRKAASILILFMSVAFLSFACKPSILTLLPVIPIFGYAVLSNEPFLDYSKHYMLVPAAFIVFSSIQTLIRADTVRLIFLCRIAIIFNVIIILLHVVGRNWLFYFYPIDNFDSVQLAIAGIDSDQTILTHGVGSPWVGHGRNFQISDDFSDQDLAPTTIQYILINKRVVFWEVLEDDKFSQIRSNLAAINSSTQYNQIFNDNDVVLLRKLDDSSGRGEQTDWSSGLEDYFEINQVKAKHEFINKFRSL